MPPIEDPRQTNPQDRELIMHALDGFQEQLAQSLPPHREGSISTRLIHFLKSLDSEIKAQEFGAAASPDDSYRSETDSEIARQREDLNFLRGHLAVYFRITEAVGALEVNGKLLDFHLQKTGINDFQPTPDMIAGTTYERFLKLLLDRGLNHESCSVRRLSAEALTGIPIATTGVDPRHELLGSAKPAPLADTTDPAATRMLQAQAQPTPQEAAAKSLTGITDQETTKLLCQTIFNDPNPDVQRAAVRAFAGRTDKEALKVLFKALKHPDGMVVGEAYDLLTKIEDEAILSKVKEALGPRYAWFAPPGR